MDEQRGITPEDLLLFIARNFDKIRNIKAYAERLVDMNNCTPFEEWIYFELCREMERVFGLQFVHDNMPIVSWVLFILRSIMVLENQERSRHEIEEADILGANLITRGLKLFLRRTASSSGVVYDYSAIRELFQILHPYIVRGEASVVQPSAEEYRPVPWTWQNAGTSGIANVTWQQSATPEVKKVTWGQIVATSAVTDVTWQQSATLEVKNVQISEAAAVQNTKKKPIRYNSRMYTYVGKLPTIDELTQDEEEALEKKERLKAKNKRKNKRSKAKKKEKLKEEAEEREKENIKEKLKEEQKDDKDC